MRTTTSNTGAEEIPRLIIGAKYLAIYRVEGEIDRTNC